MNVLVTGANGQLGSEMRIVCRGSHDNYFFTDVMDASEGSINMLRNLVADDSIASTEHLDITNLTDIRLFVSKYDINAIINCAAYTNVDAAEDNKRMSELLNTQAPEYLATVMKEMNGLLIHISTDYVFGGDPYNTPCKENQIGTPTGVYGLTKLQGEQALQKVGCDYIIIRTSWLYSEFGKNFVKTMLNLTSTKPQLKVVFDQVGTPTYAHDLAKAIFDIIEQRKFKGNTGIYHYSNEGVCSWFDFAKMIAEYSGNIGCDIQPCHSDEFQSPVKRPAYSVLDKTKFKEVFGIQVPYWTDSLRHCIRNILNIR
jgi:dTDP-4-dehydrorhamnose reductase